MKIEIKDAKKNSKLAYETKFKGKNNVELTNALIYTTVAIFRHSGLTKEEMISRFTTKLEQLDITSRNMKDDKR